MSKARITIFTRLIVVTTLVVFMVAQDPGVLSSAEAVKATVSFKHKPIKYFIAGHRIQVEAKVTDTQGVSLVRCYFRAAGQADFVFVGMKAGEKDAFTGILPSPSAETKAIEYLFLSVNRKNQVVKTQTFRTKQKATTDVSDWQKVSGEGHVALRTELPQATAPQGFTDSVTNDVVESSARFGIVAGIYGMTRIANGGNPGGGTTPAGATADSAATAVFAGTVAASGGLTAMVIVGASAAAVAVGAGVAIAGGSGGDGGKTTSACAQYVGYWSITWGYDGRKDHFMVESDCSVLYYDVKGTINGNHFTLIINPSLECSLTMEGTFTSSTTASGSRRPAPPCSGVDTWSATKQ